MKILFLDFDGCLNSENWFRNRKVNDAAHSRQVDEDFWLNHLDPAPIKLLNQIISETGAKIVISSTWRIGRTLGEINRLLRKKGFEHWDSITDVTPVLHEKRGLEIQSWLDKNEVDRFVILDDDSDMLNLTPYLIQTSGREGLTPEIAQQIISALNS